MKYLLKNRGDYFTFESMQDAIHESLLSEGYVLVETLPLNGDTPYKYYTYDDTNETYVADTVRIDAELLEAEEAAKWALVYDYRDNTIPDYTVVETSHTYTIKSKDLVELRGAVGSLPDDFIIYIKQDAPLESFDASVFEVKIVLMKAEELRQNKHREIFTGV